MSIKSVVSLLTSQTKIQVSREMDLIAEYASDSESDQNQPEAPPEVPPEGESGPSAGPKKKKKKKKASENSATAAEILKKKEKKEKKKNFKKSLDQYPEKFDDHYLCNFCPQILNRRSISRHMKNKHAEAIKLKWQYTVTKPKKLRPSVQCLKWSKKNPDDPNDRCITVGITWSNSVKRTYNLGSMIGTKVVQAHLTKVKEGPPCNEKIIAESEFCKKMQEAWEKSKKENGKFGSKIEYCAICHDEPCAVNKSVIYHPADPNNLHHLICSKCIAPVMKADRSAPCPICRQPGHGVRLYHRY